MPGKRSMQLRPGGEECLAPNGGEEPSCPNREERTNALWRRGAPSAQRLANEKSQAAPVERSALDDAHN